MATESPSIRGFLRTWRTLDLLGGETRVICGVQGDTMAHDVYYHFPQGPGQARRAGARGGKATARNRRQRLNSAAAEVPDQKTAAAPQFHIETTATAIALLDAQCPWLRSPSRTVRIARSPDAALLLRRRIV